MNQKLDFRDYIIFSYAAVCIIVCIGLATNNVTIAFTPSEIDIPEYNLYSGYKLNITSEVKEFLTTHFNNHTEYAVCLEGYYESNYTIIINNISEYITGTSKEVVSPECKGKNVIGHLHLHPLSLCYPSNSDMQVWRDYEREGLTLFMIQCTNNTYAVFDQQDLKQQYMYTG